MKKLSTNDTRKLFLDFFAKNGHSVLPSSPLVPQNDPTLLFTNAGMVQFKNIFTGVEKPQTPRAVTSQKCVRAGGKHNDLDNVGYTARHHTFFEMLGNFSFGDYFKDQAIELAWNLLTKDVGFNPEKLLVTVYHTDDEAFNIWKKITGFPDQKIIRIPTNDNFWAMGDTGPCGPCSEIFYDHGDKIPGGPPGSPDQDGDRFIEIWNLVFMQFEQRTKEERVPLPKPSIDTGMGLERFTAVLQGVHDNYDIDLFKALINASAELTKTKTTGEQGISHRVIADHLRSSCFLIADGVLPSNEGRGYVLRRIMRRAMRHAHMLGAKEPLMHRLVPSLIEQMGEAYPELGRARALTVETLRQEEERFGDMLGRGLKLLDEESGKLQKGQKLKGDVAFTLYDTYGFPLDLTEDILRSRGVGVDTEGFEKHMDEQRDRSRANWAGSGEKGTESVWFEIKEKVGATKFLGYEKETSDATVTIARPKSGTTNDALGAGEEGYIVLDQTPFYGESGGQIGDTGWLKQNGEKIAEVLDVQKPVGDLFVHHVKTLKAIKKGDKVFAEINVIRRNRTRANHSATHLLHEVLRRQLGEHITQKGSQVGPDKLRFDISHPKALTREEIASVEEEVNRIIWLNTEVTTGEMSPDEAIKKGAMALFGEKYGDRVRVLTMGASHGEPGHSVELCGGTHVRRTGDIGLFKITSESALASGVRRLEAVTGPDAFAFLNKQDSVVKELSQQFKTTPDTLIDRVGQLVEERKKMEKELTDAKRTIAMGGGGGGGEVARETIGNIQFASKSFEDLPPKDLRPLAEGILKQLNTGVAVVASGFEGKASLVVAVSKDLTDRINAAELIQVAVPVVGGKGGGGRPDMAQGGGPDSAKISDAIAAIKETVSKKAA